MKCLECDGKGFIEYHYGLSQVQCTACHGIGVMPLGASIDKGNTEYEAPIEPDTNAGIAPSEETSNADIDIGTEQPDKPARKPYTRKSTKPRKRPKGRKA